jgi:coronin-1B/1C/6
VSPVKERPVPVPVPSEDKVPKPIFVEQTAKVADKIPEIPNPPLHPQKEPEVRSPTPPSPAPAHPPGYDAIADQLVQVTSLLDQLNKKVASQSELISALTKELSTLKSGVDSMASEENRRKDEIIRKLELELEASRS